MKKSSRMRNCETHTARKPRAPWRAVLQVALVVLLMSGLPVKGGESPMADKTELWKYDVELITSPQHVCSVCISGT